MSDFATRLADAGVLVPTGVPGVFGRSLDFERALEAVSDMAGRAAADQHATFLRFPPVMPRPDFNRTGFVESFPQLIGSVSSFMGDDRAHARVRAASEEAEDWTKELEPTEVMMCSSACHPLYPTITGAVPEGGRVFDILGWCFRHEPSADPARMQCFRQRELVYVGNPEGAVAHRDRWAERAEELLGGLALEVSGEVANDPFFGRAGRIMAAAQREDALKIEVLAPVTEGQLTAIASSNYHRDHFGSRFGIHDHDGEAAHSACVGFGLERIVLALLAAHGLDVGRWPAAVRSQLWP